MKTTRTAMITKASAAPWIVDRPASGFTVPVTATDLGDKADNAFRESLRPNNCNAEDACTQDVGQFLRWK
jgi:hypothetical protein